VLVLTRKLNQSIMIGDDIEVTILLNDGVRVRLGIQAPAAIPVHRAEIYRKIQAERQEGTVRARMRRSGSTGS
jgi:carbon storage regulator